MDIPAKVKVLACIEQGSVYHFHLKKINKDGTPYEGDRFFIVLNSNPKTDGILILVTMSKQIISQKAYVKRIGEDSDTLVLISKADFGNLTGDSIVNCNNIYQKTLDGLIGDIENGGKIFFDKLPNDIISALITGVMKSKQVSMDFKKLVI